MERIRVLLVDDHTIVRQGLRCILATDDEIEVVGEAGDGRSAVELSERLQPDVVVMDLTLPELNGIEATRRIYPVQLGERQVHHHHAGLETPADRKTTRLNSSYFRSSYPASCLNKQKTEPT